MNYALREGEITSSDHIPVILKLSTSVIVDIEHPRRLIKKTDWDQFRTKVKEDMTGRQDELDLEGNTVVNQRIIDDEIQEWYNSITRRLDETTPRKTFALLPHPKESDYLKLLKIAYEVTKTRNRQLQPEDIQININIQREIASESLRLQNEKWKEIIQKLDIDYKEPKIFSDKMRRLMGGSKGGDRGCIWSADRQKLYNKRHKVNRFKETWQPIFETSPEENAASDEHRERSGGIFAKQAKNNNTLLNNRPK